MRRFLERRLRGARGAILSKYSSEELQRALVEAFGERRLGECQTRVVVPAFDRQRREIHVFKTPHHERFRIDWRERAVDVALATAAAPTYLPGHRLENGVSLLDGGIWANNPVGLAVVEAVAVLGWKQSELRVLSLGCTEAPFKVKENAGRLPLLFRMADIFLVGQSRGAVGTAKLLLGQENLDSRFFRFQHNAADGEFGLDVVDQIPTLRGIGAGMAREALPHLVKEILSTPREAFFPYYGPVEALGAGHAET